MISNKKIISIYKQFSKKSLKVFLRSTLKLIFLFCYTVTKMLQQISLGKYELTDKQIDITTLKSRQWVHKLWITIIFLVGHKLF